MNTDDGTVGRRLTSVPLEHQGGTACVGSSWEDAMEGGGGTGRLRKVISCSNTGGVVVWGRDLGVVDANGV